MFNERDALRLRLEQLAEQEERFLKLFREEREIIFNKLRELDEKTPVAQATIESIQTEERPSEIAPKIQAEPQTKPAEKASKRGRKPTVTPEKEAAIEILKMNPEGMKGVDLQRAVEEATGSSIANMTTFMKSVENLDPHVQKPNRGTYIYIDSDSPFLED